MRFSLPVARPLADCSPRPERRIRSRLALTRARLFAIFAANPAAKRTLTCRITLGAANVSFRPVSLATKATCIKRYAVVYLPRAIAGLTFVPFLTGRHVGPRTQTPASTALHRARRRVVLWSKARALSAHAPICTRSCACAAVAACRPPASASCAQPGVLTVSVDVKS